MFDRLRSALAAGWEQYTRYHALAANAEQLRQQREAKERLHQERYDGAMRELGANAQRVEAILASPIREMSEEFFSLIEPLDRLHQLELVKRLVRANPAMIATKPANDWALVNGPFMADLVKENLF